MEQTGPAVLEKVGLSRNEVKTYLALLELGKTSSGALIKKTALNSAKVYESLAKLQTKGLAGYIQTEGKKIFEASCPERLMDFVDEKKKELEQQTRHLQKAIPALKLSQKRVSQEAPTALMYQGLKGFKAIYSAMYDEVGNGEEYLAIGSGRFKKAVGGFWYWCQDTKRRKKIHSRVIWDKTITNYEDYIATHYGDGRVIASMQDIGSIGIVVWNDKILESSYEGNNFNSVVIQSKVLARTYTNLIETLWGIGYPPTSRRK